MSTAVAIAQQYIAHVYAGQLTEAAVLLAADVELTMGGGGGMRGVYHGRDAYFAAFARMMTLTNGTYSTVGEPRWIDGGDVAIALATEQVVREGATIRLDRVITFDVTGDTIARVRVYEGNPEDADRAFAA